ncbi:helix-turn-helix domain-containing protein [Dietzia sp. ANT_WB102]|uniref:helix-turn-helix domain-containing protein n=1 Tax=Dietzia sp. ANT_WB102 TaxID=2597345 RepID=UPI0011EE8343|nr:helix-turn-helix domain-containing protein [Dietzia sp. ANT_WB102]KAA0916429.1 helix-turn-helix domain-containing protein [Dietzia sp. ANT_WB102]
MTPTELLTSTQAGVILGKSSRTVIRLIEAGAITPLGKLNGPNGPYVLTRTAVEDYAEKTLAA